MLAQLLRAATRITGHALRAPRNLHSPGRRRALVSEQRQRRSYSDHPKPTSRFQSDDTMSYWLEYQFPPGSSSSTYASFLKDASGLIPAVIGSERFFGPAHAGMKWCTVSGTDEGEHSLKAVAHFAAREVPAEKIADLFFASEWLCYRYQTKERIGFVRDSAKPGEDGGEVAGGGFTATEKAPAPRTANDPDTIVNVLIELTPSTAASHVRILDDLQFALLRLHLPIHILGPVSNQDINGDLKTLFWIPEIRRCAAELLKVALRGVLDRHTLSLGVMDIEVREAGPGGKLVGKRDVMWPIGSQRIDLSKRDDWE